MIRGLSLPSLRVKGKQSLSSFSALLVPGLWTLLGWGQKLFLEEPLENCLMQRNQKKEGKTENWKKEGEEEGKVEAEFSLEKVFLQKFAF